MSKTNLKSETLTAHNMGLTNGELSLEKLTYPNIYIPNKGLSISLLGKDNNDEIILGIQREINEYNAYIDYLLEVDGFWEKFKEKGYFISKDECISAFGKDDAEKIFCLKDYAFQTSLCKNGKWLFIREAEWRYCVETDGLSLEFEITETDSGYTKEVTKGKKKYSIFWNWYEDERDFCYYLWEMAYNKGLIAYSEDDIDVFKDYSHFECYDQGRDCMDKPDPNLMKVFKLLQDMGYLSVYYIEPDVENPVWQLRMAPDGRIGMILLDNGFEKNSLLMEKIGLLLNCPEDSVDDYILTNEDGHQYQSKEKGTFGGHNKLKIYGRMDCLSANRYVKAGKYVQHRVFFADEQTAIKAGYRPCAKCMPKEYNKWKSSNG